MVSLNLDQTTAKNLQQALALHQQGKLADAERLYRGVLGSVPDKRRVIPLLPSF
jgi:hypothetical protein